MDYQRLKATAHADCYGSKSQWDLAAKHQRHTLAYGPVSFHGTTLYQEVIWSLGLPGQGNLVLVTDVQVENLYDTHG